MFAGVARVLRFGDQCRSPTSDSKTRISAGINPNSLNLYNTPTVSHLDGSARKLQFPPETLLECPIPSPASSSASAEGRAGRGAGALGGAGASADGAAPAR